MYAKLLFATQAKQSTIAKTFNVGLIGNPASHAF